MQQVDYERPDGAPDASFYVLDVPDWVNIIAIDDEQRVLLVRQFRFGVAEMTLEIPGGMCDPNESPHETAQRELREETGYAARDWTDLGWVHPNPPVQNNRCHTFLARGAHRVGDPQPDEHEAMELHRAPIDEVYTLMAGGRITHALVLSAFQRLALSDLGIVK